MSQSAETAAPDRVAPLNHSVIDSARIIGVSRTTVYEEIKAGRLRTIKLGTRTLVPASSIRDYQAQLERGGMR